MKKRYLLLSAIALLLPLAAVYAQSAQQPLATEGDDSVAKQKVTRGYVEAMRLLKDNYAGELNYDKLTKSSILGMLQRLDPHSAYLDRIEWKSYKDKQSSHYSGLGTNITQYGDGVYLTNVFKGAPAHKVGLRYGDKIIEVDGQSAEGLNVRQLSSRLIGPERTVVSVKVERVGAAQALQFKVVRESISLPSVTGYFMVAPGVGYINLQRGFNTTTYGEVREAINSLRQQGMTSLIFDLRDNPGGLVEQGWQVANIFLNRGQTIVSIRGRLPLYPQRDLMAFNISPDDYPLVVLINRETASAAEIVAGALQDHDRARIVGESSFGKGLVQMLFDLSDGSALALTTGKYYTPSGRLIQRDYSRRSFYDYYFKRGDKDSARPTDEKRTDAGRKVFGGDGIKPDVEVSMQANYIKLKNVWLEPVFLFVRQLIAGNIAGAGEFKLDRSPDTEHPFAPTDYVVTDKVLRAFKSFLGEHSGFKPQEMRADADASFLKMQIRYELVVAAYGQEVASSVLVEGDTQLQRAIAEVPNARMMAEDARRLRAKTQPQNSDGLPPKN